ncbi:MAG: DUF4188 domain-containing protein [Proteobacteria bacterium]|nr:MAG: DUF4188 domain-containing protein [Pseudomonadota bacterium]
MSKVSPGRFTAEVNRDFVVFIIGMRVNKWWLPHKWLPVATAMPRMLIKLGKDRSLGMLGAESFFRFFPLTTTLISYWKSFEDLERFATDRSLPHAAAWADFMKSIGSTGTVGIYHETYKVKRGDFECVYANMPKFGLAAAFNLVPIQKAKDSARSRISEA